MILLNLRIGADSPGIASFINIFLINYADLQIIQMQQNNKQILQTEWNKIYTSKDSKFVLLGNVESYKFRKEGKHFVALNKTYPGKLDFNLIKIAKEKKAVFIQFDSNKYNYTNISNKETLFHVNLDEEEIITKENAYKITQNFFDKEDADEEDRIEGHAHPILINTAPICKYHSLLIMYPDEELPQIVGSDIVLLLLNLFKVFPTIKIGYNSVGGSSSMNHLHFHLIYSQDLVSQAHLPIEDEPRKIWKQTSLVNPKEQINLYNVGIKIEEIQSSMCNALVLSPLGQNLQPSQVANSLSFVFGIVANELIELCIAHNILFSGNGNTIYIILREFASQGNMYGWLQFSGLIPANTENDYGIKEEQIISIKQKLQVDKKLIQALKKNITKNLQSFI